MIIVFIRAILLYIFVLITIRIMGKGELAEMQPFELVIILMIAELAALPMEDLGTPLLEGFVAIGTLLILQVLVSYLNLKSQTIRKIVCGKPSIIINKGKIDEKELKRLRISINDLVEQLRSKNYPSVQDVEFAILETNGDLSIIPKANKKTVTIEDLQIAPSYDGLPTSLIIDGNVLYDNLDELGLSEKWLMSQLKAQGLSSPKEVLFSFVDDKKELFTHKKDSKQRSKKI
ncbi:DUF421 domain-containing protein [Sporosalibacterium faouarense]|uniref:DUF421 domain-containing protein n=1 Tax=Sporosalibacterium faouarense TaxID=516123 RepID=UPI00192C3E92|nr:DUF421 domain-containing protein [Sporosalibacterium faouarense]